MCQVKFSLVGIYGGTFDPIHFGHLRIAEALLDMVGFSQIYFVPSGMPRLRNTPVASSYHRLNMVRLAISHHPLFRLDDRETKRTGESISANTLGEYRDEFNADDALCFIMGIDTFMKLPQWYDWRELFNLCHLILVGRPGYISIMNHEKLSQDLRVECAARWVSSVDDLKYQSNGLIFTAPTALLDISATTIRALIHCRKSVRYLLPEIVFDYIKVNHIYSEKG